MRIQIVIWWCWSSQRPMNTMQCNKKAKKANTSESAKQWTINMHFSFSFWIFSNRVDNSLEEAISAEVWIVEHSTIGQTFVNGKRLSTRFVTKWRKRKVDLDILLQTFLLDRFHQFKLMWPSVGNNEDDSVVGHFVQGEVNSWAMSLISP